MNSSFDQYIRHKIQAIIFDWGDTLASSGLERYFPVQKVKRKFKLNPETIDLCLKMLLEILVSVKTSYTPHTLEQEKKALSDFWFSVAKKIKVENPNLFVGYLLDWTFEKYAPSLFPEVLETVRFLFKQKYHLAVLSNGWPKRFLEIKKSKIGKYFKTILVSSLVGAEKPDIKAYQIALKKIRIPACQVLMIDNKEDYLVPAFELGIKVLYLDRIDFNSNSKFSRIKNVSEVVDYLRKTDFD